MIHIANIEKRILLNKILVSRMIVSFLFIQYTYQHEGLLTHLKPFKQGVARYTLGPWVHSWINLPFLPWAGYRGCIHQYFMLCSINYAKKIWKGHTNIKFLPTSLLLSSLNSSDSGLLVALKLFRNWNATGVFRCFGSFRTTSSS